MANTGLGSALGFATETTWNTPVATTVIAQFMAESMTRSIDRIEPQTLAAGNRMLTSSGWRAGASTYEGDIEFQLLDLGLEEWWRAAMGGYAFSVDTHTFTPGALAESLTAAFGFGGDTSVPTKTYSGVAVDTWELEATAGGTDAAKFSVGVVAGGEVVADSGSIAGTEPAGVGAFTGFDVSTLTFGGTAFECVKAVTISGNNNLKKDRFCLGQTGIADPRVETARREYEGVLTIDFTDFTTAPAWYTAFTAGTEAALIVEFTSGTKVLTITGNVRVDGETPEIDGTDIIEVDVPVKFVATAGDESGISIDLNNGSTALS